MHIGIVLPGVPKYSETFFRSKITGLLNKGFSITLFVKNGDGKNNFLCPVKVHPQLYENIVLRFIQSIFILLGLFLKAPKPTVNIIRLTKRSGYGLSESIRAAVIAASILPERLDWLHFGFATPAIKREYVGHAIGAKVAVSFRGFDLNQTPLNEENPYRHLWKNVDGVHSISKYLIQKGNEQGMEPDTPFTVITPAIDLDIYQNNSANRKEASILLVSRLHWIKGIDYVLEALTMINSSKVSMTIAGDGDELDRLVFASEQLGIADRVSFIGKVSNSEVPELMLTHELFIQFSNQEGFCNAALEAQASGMLCIVSDAEGLTENVVDQETGWVVPKRNPKRLAEKIDEVINLPKSKKSEIRMNARHRIEEEFTIEEQIEKFIAFYTS